MPAKKTFQSARFRGPVTLEGGVIVKGIPTQEFYEYTARLTREFPGAPLAVAVLASNVGSPSWVSPTPSRLRAVLPGHVPITKFLPSAVSPFIDGNGERIYVSIFVGVNSGTGEKDCTIMFTAADGLEVEPADFDLRFELKFYR